MESMTLKRNKNSLLVPQEQNRLCDYFYGSYIGFGAGGGVVPDITVGNSVIFNDNDSPTLDFTPSSAGNRRSMSFSFWLKRGNLAEQMVIYNGAANDYIQFRSDDIFNIILSGTGGSADYRTTRKFRDPSAWYHFVIAIDTANATSTERMKLYVNGRQETEFGTYTAITQNSDLSFTNTVKQQWGNYQTSSGIYWDGYLAEVCFVDGSTLGPDSFGKFNANGVWVPKTPAVTYGTTGYKLDFADSSALGNDVSGNNNDFTVNNITSTDQSTDTPTLVYPTHADNHGRYTTNDGGGTVLSEGNRHVTKTGANYSISELNSIPLSSGKYYCCTRPDTVQNLNGELGIMPRFAREKTVDYYYDYTDDGIIYGMELTTKMNLQGSGITNVMVTFPVTPENSADLLVMAIDFDNSKLWAGIYDDSANELFWYKTSAGAWSSANEDIPGTGSDETITLPSGDGYMFYTRNYASRGSILGFGSGNLLSKFTAPSGFSEINSSTAPTPTIPDPTSAFQVITYTGTGATNQIIQGSNSYGHRLGSGDRSRLIIATGNGGSYSPSAGSVLINGNFTDGPGITSYADDMNFKFQFPEAVNITEAMIHFQSAGGNLGTWKWQGSNNDSDWTDVSSNEDLTSCGTVNVITLDSIGASATYSYYRFIKVSGGVNSNQWEEFSFKVKPTSNDRAVSTFKPDLVLIKNRDQADHWKAFDTVQTAESFWLPSDDANIASDSNSLTSFNTNGFTLGTGAGGFNDAGERFVAHCWSAGGGASQDNENGSINTTNQIVSTANGFSISKFTGTGANATVGHGLSGADFFILKHTDASSTSTPVWHTGLDNATTGYIYLDKNNAEATSSTAWNSTAPTSTLISLGSSTTFNTSSQVYYLYCWKSIEGFSDFGKYIGNGANGSMVYTGFKPAVVWIKRINSTGDWVIYDRTRSPANEVDDQLLFTSASETTGSEEIDILATGFKARTSDSAISSGASSYVYCAWAENPTYGGLDGAPATAV